MIVVQRKRSLIHWVFAICIVTFVTYLTITSSGTSKDILYEIEVVIPEAEKLIQNEQVVMKAKKEAKETITEFREIHIAPLNFSKLSLNSLSARFWDLMRAKDNSQSEFNSVPISIRELGNLWREVETFNKAIKGGDEIINNKTFTLDDRIIPQLIWQMDSSHQAAEMLKPKIIFLTNRFKGWYKGEWQDEQRVKGFKTLESSDCQESPHAFTKCLFFEDRKDVEKVDAIVTVRSSPNLQKPPELPDAWKSAFHFHFALESPLHSKAYLETTKDLLASFWRGSDLVTPYSKWVYYDPNVKSKPQDKKYHLGKTKAVAAFISNCYPSNDRDGYIKELQKHIQVDVYGTCGSFRCSRKNENECNNILKKDYYFYLAFENSNCRDYITEKLFSNAYKNDVVPIVMGAHPDDYKALTPENSYIHVEDFENPQELSKYLKHLMETPTEYDKYFDWKGTGEFLPTETLCRICSMVHYADFVPPPERTEKLEWDSHNSVDTGMCLEKKRRYWTRDDKSAVIQSTSIVIVDP